MLTTLERELCELTKYIMWPVCLQQQMTELNDRSLPVLYSWGIFVIFLVPGFLDLLSSCLFSTLAFKKVRTLEEKQRNAHKRYMIFQSPRI